LLPRVIIDTSNELLLKVLQGGHGLHPRFFLRRLHNFCVDMKLAAVAVDSQAAMAGYPVQGTSGAITWDEHLPDHCEGKEPGKKKAFYQLGLGTWARRSRT